MREKNGTILRKKKEETEELCDWVVGFKMRTEREWNRFKKRRRRRRNRGVV